ncbi:MAG: PASTA domain-containing protein [Clostridiales bacterium]|nr:PASTA domain-containing protein [Clostridiales bacterium]
MKLGSFCISAVRKMDTDLPPDLVPGCAAIAQYVMDYVPSESTDVYGFAASLFFALTGTLPQDALKRRTDTRLLIPTSILRSLPPHVVSALANALQVSPDKRTPTFERLRAELSAAPTVTATIEETQRIPGAGEDGDREKKGVPNFVWVILTCVAALIVFTIVGIIWISNSDQSGAETLASSTSQVESSESEIPDSPLNAEESEDPNLIAAPSFIGQNFKELTSSESSSADQDYQVLLSTKQFSDTIPEGCIISQSPAPGTKMAKGTAIVVVVSEGAAVRTLPSITGKTLAEASEAVTSAGFTPTKTEEYSSTVPEGLAIGYKDVKEGSQMAYGSEVVIVISKGPASGGDDTTS